MNIIEEPTVPQRADEVIAKRLHLSAIEKIRESVDGFASTLILQSKIMAYAGKAEVVLSRHVEEALDHLVRRRRKNWLKDVFKVVGGVFMGVSVPGLIKYLPTTDIRASVFYVVLGFIGMLLVFLGTLI